ncbi:MAG: L-aspartate oxidase [Microthrixaceae bacterium]
MTNHPLARGASSDLDLLVLGSGIAGLSAAVRAAELAELRVGVLTKAELDLATTRWAQGGVAAALSGESEETDLHLADTLSAGVGLCDLDAVRVLVDEGPDRVHDLIALGARFDRDAAGELMLAREGGHSVPRIVHAGGAATGAEIERALVEVLRRTAAEIHEHAFALDLLVEDGRCRGVRALTMSGEVVEIAARHVLLATGGAGQLFAVTTNPPVATGDGVAMALRAGVSVADLEFFQFHPTALDHPSMPRPLLSEALRGHGALLRDADGERFVDELLPRDVVSRAITARMIEQDIDHVWLDATVLPHFELRFPTINADLERVGLDPSADYLPVAPAAHHQCGGVVTDLDGATTLSGLWAAGETSCTGVHGANRLASNSLLEGMVFGARVVEAIARGKDAPDDTGAMRSARGLGSTDTVIGGRSLVPPETVWADAATPVPSPDEVATARRSLQRAMTLHAGVLRTAESIAQARLVIDGIAGRLPERPLDPATCELANLAVVGAALLEGAQQRTESRGAHTRVDFPGTHEELRLRLVVQQ